MSDTLLGVLIVLIMIPLTLGIKYYLTQHDRNHSENKNSDDVE